MGHSLRHLSRVETSVLPNKAEHRLYTLLSLTYHIH